MNFGVGRPKIPISAPPITSLDLYQVKVPLPQVYFLNYKYGNVDFAGCEVQ